MQYASTATIRRMRDYALAALLLAALTGCGTQFGQIMLGAAMAPAQPTSTTTVITPKGAVLQYRCFKTESGQVCYPTVVTSPK